MRKIYFFLPTFPNWTTGGHRFHTFLFEFFKSKKTDVSSFGHHKYSKITENSKILKIISGMYYIFRIPKHSMLIMSNSSFLNFYFPVLINKFWKNHFYFLIVHHLVQDERPTYFRKKLENYFISKAGKVITVSRTTQQKLYDLNLGLEGIEIFIPGLDIDQKVKQKKKIFPDKFKILFVGTIEERKGILYLIEALKLITFQDFELNIIGEELNAKAYYAKLISIISDSNLKNKVFFRGKVSRQELEDYYLNSSIFVFPSLWEGYGLVVAEAMAYGLPVIASRIPAIGEIIDDEENGFLVESKDSKQIAEKINLLKSNQTLLIEISENAKKKSLTFPDWKQTWENIYNSINRIP
jgi:glycosyltransferase involved in cell wall biosynthesis